MIKNKEKVCCICKKKYIGWGNSARPVKDGRCCDACNYIVLTERTKQTII